MTTHNEADTWGSWQFDPPHTLVEFSAKHMMITTVKGNFKSTRVEMLSSNHGLVVDDLTIHGVTREVVLEYGVGNRWFPCGRHHQNRDRRGGHQVVLRRCVPADDAILLVGMAQRGGLIGGIVRG